MRSKKIDSLQVVRALAFIMIFADHTMIPVLEPGGWWGVSVFFVLSGFLMTYSYFDSDRIKQCDPLFDLKFGIGKIKRIYPLHILTMIYTIPWLVISHAGFQGMEKITHMAKTILVNSLLLQSWIPMGAIYYSLNAVSWYLSVSLFLYIVFPIIIMIIRKYKKRSTAVYVVILTMLIQTALAYLVYLKQDPSVTVDRFNWWFTYVFPLSRLEEFVMGCNLGYIFLKTDFSRIKKRVFTLLEVLTFILILAAMILDLVMFTFPRINDKAAGLDCWWYDAVIYSLSSCMLVLLFAINKGAVSSFLNKKVLVFIGDISASAFLLHQIILRTLWKAPKIITGKPRLILCGVIGFVITICLSFLWEKYINGAFNGKKLTFSKGSFHWS